MPVLVTGASGFVGLAVTEALLARGSAVVALDAAPMPPAAQARFAHLPGALRTTLGDVCDKGVMAQAMQGVHSMIVAAAVTAGQARELTSPEPVIAVNVGSVATAVRLAAKAGLRRVVHISSVAAYGATASTAGPLTEDMPCRPQALYGITKLAGETTALRLADLTGLDLAAVRLGAVFGPWEHATGLRDTLSPQLQIVAAARRDGAIVLDENAVRDWLYVRDAAGAILAVLDAPSLRHRLFNVGSGVSWPLSAWCAAMQPQTPWCVGPAPTVQSWGARPPLAIDRLLADTPFRPRFGVEEAAADWRHFLSEVGDASLESRSQGAGMTDMLQCDNPVYEKAPLR